MHRLLFISLLLSLLAHSLTADEPQVKRILFVGNSYTGGIKAIQSSLLKHFKVPKVDFVHPGGKTLTWHLANGTPDLIRKGDYDIVVLQEQSQTPAYPGLQEKFWKSSTELAKVIRASGARPVLYMTWGRRDGDKQNAHVAPTYEKMQSLLTASYNKAGELAEAEVVPVGSVWAKIRMADEKLARSMYARDGSHPSQLGAYITAMTFTCVLLNQTPDNIPTPDSLRLKAGELKLIRTAVSEVTAPTRETSE